MPSISCPKCCTNLEFDIKEILKGKTFTCTNCNTNITLTYEDHKKTLAKAAKELDKLKDELDID